MSTNIYTTILHKYLDFTKNFLSYVVFKLLEYIQICNYTIELIYN